MKYFKRSEFECFCGCGFNTVDYELAEVVDKLREHFNAPVFITSGCRCEAHNKAIGGAKSSKHMLGIASDLKVAGVNPTQVYDYLNKEYPNKYGIGLYRTWVHIDIRADKARW